MAIEFDWILKTQEGKDFLQYLSETENLRIFDNEIIKYIVYHQWNKFLPYICVLLFVPFLIHFVLFLFYATWLYHETEVEDDKNGEYYPITLTIAIIILFFQFFFTLIEILQVYHHRWHYFTSIYNLFDLFSILLNTTCVVLHFTNANEKDFNAAACVAVLVIWFRFFYLLRVISTTAYLIRMILEIIWDMKWFTLALFIAICAFGNSLYVIGRNADDNLAGTNLLYGFIYSYKLGFGDFDTDNFAGYRKSDEGIIWGLWLIDTVVILIILLNLVIAIMGDTYDNVTETQEAAKLQEFCQMMRENEFLIRRNRVFSNEKYIVIIKPESADENVSSSWEGKLQQLKKFVVDSSQEHLDELSKMQRRMEIMIENSINEKMKAAENTINLKISGMAHVSIIYHYS
jgi:ABC-type multidrug transport system fused ATPase/permease subunit